MTRGEQRFHTVTKSGMWGAIMLMLLALLFRFADFGRGSALTEVLFLLGMFAFFASPPLIGVGVLQAAIVRWKMHIQHRSQERRPSFLVFAAGTLTTFFMWFTFKMVPLFAGEARVQRTVFDQWLDRLL